MTSSSAAGIRSTGQRVMVNAATIAVAESRRETSRQASKSDGRRIARSTSSSDSESTAAARSTAPPLRGSGVAPISISTASGSEPATMSRRISETFRRRRRRSPSSTASDSLSLPGAAVTICRSLMPDGIPPYLLVARIGSVLGMSFALAIGLLLLIGGLVVPAIIALLMFIPSIGLMLLVERHAATPPR